VTTNVYNVQTMFIVWSSVGSYCEHRLDTECQAANIP